MIFIYRQEILKGIRLFTSQPKAKFYDNLFIDLDLSCIPERNFKTGRTPYSNHAMICAFIVMLSNNLIIAYYCGFDISGKLPSYAKFTRFIRELDNNILQSVMQSSVLNAVDLSLIDISFIVPNALLFLMITDFQFCKINKTPCLTKSQTLNFEFCRQAYLLCPFLSFSGLIFLTFFIGVLSVFYTSLTLFYIIISLFCKSVNNFSLYIHG